MQGLSACTALTQLVLISILLMDNNGQVILNEVEGLAVVPTNIGLLTRLHTLILSQNACTLEVANLGWMSELACLQCLAHMHLHTTANR